MFENILQYLFPHPPEIPFFPIFICYFYQFLEFLGIERIFPSFTERKKRSIDALEKYVKDKPVIERKVEEIEASEIKDFKTIYENYIYKGVPLVIRGLTKGENSKSNEGTFIGNWNLKDWNLRGFAKEFPEEKISVKMHHKTDTRKDMTFSEVIDMPQKPYYSYVPNHMLGEKMKKDLDSKIFKQILGSEPKFQFSILFLGGTDSIAQPHNDPATTISIQLEGKKEWTLAPNEYTMFFYPRAGTGSLFYVGSFDALQTDNEKYPMAKYIPLIKATVYPGDVLLVPPYMWHYVYNPQPAMALGLSSVINFWNTFTFNPLFGINTFINAIPRLFGISNVMYLKTQVDVFHAKESERNNQIEKEKKLS